MLNELIVVKQLPVIEERLQFISVDIQRQVDEALALAVTEDTVKQVKKQRTELNRTFNDLEERRKAVKASVMAPYDAFEKVYKKYVTEVFRPADTKLKRRIDEVQDDLLQAKRDEVEHYFLEASVEKGIDFLDFEKLNIKVLLSDSMKKLRERVDDVLHKLAGDIAVISTMEYPEEILVEYKQNLDLTKSVLMVKNRKEMLAEELRRKAELEQRRQVADKPIAPTIVGKEPAVVPEAEIAQEPEVVPNPMAIKDLAPTKPAIIITITAHSAEEVMAITEVCKMRRLSYTIS